MLSAEERLQIQSGAEERQRTIRVILDSFLRKEHETVMKGQGKGNSKKPSVQVLLVHCRKPLGERLYQLLFHTKLPR